MLNPQEQDLLNQVRFTGSTSLIGGGMTQYFEHGGKQYATNINPGNFGSSPKDQNRFRESLNKSVVDTINRGYSDKPVQAPGVPIFQGPSMRESTVPSPQSPAPSNSPALGQSSQPFALPQGGQQSGGVNMGVIKDQFGNYSKMENGRQIQTDANGNPMSNLQPIPNVIQGIDPKTGKPIPLPQPQMIPASAPGGTQTPQAVSNTQNPLYALPGESYAQYEARQGFPQGNQPQPEANPAQFAQPGQDFNAYEASQGFTQPGNPQEQNMQNPQQGLMDLLKSHGVEINHQEVNSNPLGTADSVFQRIYNNLGLGDLKTHIEGLTKQLADVDKRIVDKQISVNSNPWLSEGARTKQLNALTKATHQERANILNELKLNETLFDKGRQDARYAAHEMLNQYNQNRNLDFRELTFRLNLAEKQLEAEQRIREHAATAAATESRFSHMEERFNRSQAAGESRFERSQAGIESRFERRQADKVKQAADKADVLKKLESGLNNMKILGLDRNTAENKFKKDNGVSNLPPNVVSVFDHVFGAQAQKTPWWHFGLF